MWGADRFIVAGVAFLALAGCQPSVGGVPPSRSSSSSATESTPGSSSVPSPVPLPADLRGRTLAFVRKDGVYVGKADGSDMHRITNLAGFEYQPDWTSDGQKLVLRVDTKTAGGTWTVSSDGSHVVDVSARMGFPGGDPDWSPDGSKIVLTAKAPSDQHFSIYVVNSDGSNAARLTTDRWESQYPDWSPDGSRIALTIVRFGSFDIYVMSADGSGLRRLTDTPGEDNWPEWSPSGRQIVYSNDSGLWIMDANGANKYELSSFGGEPSWSPDGRWIAFDCAPSSDTDGGMCAVHPDGTGLTSILDGTGSFPAWRP
jgi:TolB protein